MEINTVWVDSCDDGYMRQFQSKPMHEIQKQQQVQSD